MEQQKKPFKLRKIILVILPVFIALAVLTLLFSIERNIKPERVLVTNLTDTGATVTWYTEDANESIVYYKKKDGKTWSSLPVLTTMDKEKAYDDRDVDQNEDGDWELKDEESTKRHTHHVTLRNLEPEAEYEYRIGGNYKTVKKDKENNELATFITKQIIDDITTPDPAYGKVEGLEDDSDSLIITQLSVQTGGNIVDAEGVVKSNYVSTYLSENKTYSIDLKSFKTDSFTELPAYESNLSSINVKVVNEEGKEKTTAILLSNYKPLRTLVFSDEEQSFISNPNLISSAKAQVDCSKGANDDRKLVTDSSQCTIGSWTCGDERIYCVGTQITGTDIQNCECATTTSDVKSDEGGNQDYQQTEQTTQLETGKKEDGFRVNSTSECSQYGYSAYTCSGLNSSQEQEYYCVGYLWTGSMVQEQKCNKPSFGEQLDQRQADIVDENNLGITNSSEYNSIQQETSSGTSIPETRQLNRAVDTCTYFADNGQAFGPAHMQDIIEIFGEKYQVNGFKIEGTTGADRVTCEIGTVTQCLCNNKLVPINKCYYMGVEGHCTFIGESCQGSTKTYNINDFPTPEFCSAVATSYEQTSTCFEISNGNAYKTNCEYCKDKQTYKTGFAVDGYHCEYPSVGKTCGYQESDKPILGDIDRECSLTNFLRSENVELENSLVDVTSAASDKLVVENSGNYITYYGDDFEQPISEFAVNLDGSQKAEIRLFIDANGNGKKDEGEEVLDDYSQISLKKDSEVATYNLNVGWNLVALPVISNEGISTASELMDHFNTQGADIKHIARYTDAGFEMYTKREGDNEFSDDFNIVPGQGYFVLNYEAKEVKIKGNKFDEAVPFRVRNGWNLVGVYTNEKPYTAEELLKDMVDQGITADVASMYNSGLYTSVVYEDDLVYGNNYNLFERQGYFIRVKEGGGADIKFTPQPE